ncbi:hypothetical protein [Aneurinibacillus migulanus]|uniref:hypothetical protein n=1 Tax=Aneurinibacillus migulanus TaxID=47500 RepID=UPI0009BB271B|nr:hypothetical protein [Aneurinibacillus migulanus]
MGLFVFLMIFLFFAKKRMDNNEPVFGWQRKQYLEEQGESGKTPKRKKSIKLSLFSRNKDIENDLTLKELIELEDIRYGVFEKKRNEFCVVIATDSVNFDLLNDSARASIILGYQSLYKAIRFPVQLIGQAVRQDMRKEEKRFMNNLETCNPQTQEYNKKVINHIKARSENEFRISRRMYYVIPYIYEVSRMAKLTSDQREKKIMQELWMRASIVMKLLKRARIEANLLDSVAAMEVLKRALNRDRMLSNPIESIVAEGKEKNFPFISADVTSLPGYEELINQWEEGNDDQQAEEFYSTQFKEKISI